MVIKDDKPLANPWVDRRIQCTENIEIKTKQITPNAWYNPDLESEEEHF